MGLKWQPLDTPIGTTLLNFAQSLTKQLLLYHTALAGAQRALRQSICTQVRLGLCVLSRRWLSCCHAARDKLNSVKFKRRSSMALLRVLALHFQTGPSIRLCLPPLPGPTRPNKKTTGLITRLYISNFYPYGNGSIFIPLSKVLLYYPVTIAIINHALYQTVGIDKILENTS